MMAQSQSTANFLDRLFSLANRRVLVTGASGGLGLHFARVAYAAGAKVVLAARRKDRIEAEAEKLGERAKAVVMDVADVHSIHHAFDAIEADGVCDVIVNNAGLAKVAPALEVSPNDWNAVVDVNLRGAFWVAQEAAKRLRALQKGGSIINIASILGERVIPSVASYAASKAGLIHLTRVLAVEWARYGIRVNALAPGYFETDMNAEFFSSDAGQAMIKRIPQRRLGRLEELSGPFLLLASGAAGYMTGSIITVDGGHSVNSV